jgi:hypothetical protein
MWCRGPLSASPRGLGRKCSHKERGWLPEAAWVSVGVGCVSGSVTEAGTIQERAKRGLDGTASRMQHCVRGCETPTAFLSGKCEGQKIHSAFGRRRGKE